ncbi:hypothetical protein TrRE_jg4826 [Triparma retinervis]|uniref:Uncharacterized protein n=1 Tax=Triparma retinervis TaxID=2557542 RepID=A0A9W7ABR0_9STRA|nr:hypothetical protein TrRE_jg4826 [Triparma retinervis]
MGCAQICGGCVILLGIIVLAGGFIVGGLLTGIVDVGLKDAQKNNVYICEGDSLLTKGYESFQSLNFFTDIGTDDYTAAYDHFYLYHVVNPTDYLRGDTGKLAEIGPFTMFTFGTSFSMEVDATGISYRGAGAHVFLDGTAGPISGPGVLGVDADAPDGTFDDVFSPEGINRQTPIANFNVGYLGALGGAGTEISLLLGVSCSPTQIANIVALKPTCSDKQIAKKDPTCSCCLPDDLIGALDFGGMMNEKAICDGLKGSLDAGAIDTFVKTANSIPDATFAALDETAQMTYRVQTFIGAGAVADADAYHAMDNHTKAIFTGKMGFIAGSELRASQGVMYGTCAALQAANPAYCSVDLTGRPTNGTDLTQAEFRTIFRNNLAVGNTWPADNTNADTTSWTTTTWDAATDADRDKSIRVFSRYNAVNTPVLTGASGNQAAADAAFGGDGSTELPLATRIVVISSAPEVGGVPQNAFDAAAIRGGYATFSGETEITATEWAALTSTAQLSIVDNTYFLALGSGLAAIGAEYCSCRGNAFSSEIPVTGCCLEKGKIPLPDFSGSAIDMGEERFWCNNTVTYDYTGASGNSTQAVSAKDGNALEMDNGYWYATTAGYYAGEVDAIVPPPRSCSAFLSEDSKFVGLVSMLNDIDGGVAVKKAGDAARTASGQFAGTAFLNPYLHSGLIQTHSANDQLYGYPSALLGLLVPTAIKGLTGQDDATKKANMTDLAAYTKDFNSVCGAAAGKCTPPTGDAAATPISWTCAGEAASRSDIDEDLLKFADVGCRAASWTFSTIMFCAGVEQGVHQAVNALYAMGGINLAADSEVFTQEQALAWTTEEVVTNVRTVVEGGALAAGLDAATATATADGAVADLEAFYASTTRSAVILGQANDLGKPGFVAQSELLASQGVMYGTCAGLQAVNPAYCSVDLTGRPTTGTDLTPAEMRTIFRNNLAVGNTWPADNTNVDTTSWTTTTWDAATDAVRDESIRVFSRYNGVNTPTVAAYGGSQAAADAAFGGDGSTELPLATRIIVISSAPEVGGVPQNAFDAAAIRGGYATFSGETEITATEWAALTSTEQSKIAIDVYLNAFNLGLAAVGGVPASGFLDSSVDDDLEAVVEGFATTIDTYYCKCADGTNDFKTTGCCLSSGGGGGTDFTGFGCLQALPGWFDENLSDNDMSASMQRSVVKESSTPLTKQDYCPTDPGKMAEFSMYKGETNFIINSEMAKTSYTQVAPGIYNEDVNGGNGKFLAPMGLTSTAGDLTISTNTDKPAESLKLFVSQVSRALSLDYSSSATLGDANFLVAEFRPNEKLLWSTAGGGDADAEDKLTGKTTETQYPLSWEGTANVMPQKSLPVYLSHVNYLNGESKLLDSADVTDGGNGIEIYHCFDYPPSVAYPDTDAQTAQQAGVVDSATDTYGNSLVVDTTKCDRIDADWLLANKDDIDVFLQVEPATGFTVAGHQRLMASIAPTIDCNPLTYSNPLHPAGAHEIFSACLLGFSGTGDLGTCHSDAKILLEAMPVGDVTAGPMLQGAVAFKGGTYAPGFPCSSANLFTPQFKGGGLVPVFWLDKASELAEKGRKGFVDLGAFIGFSGMLQNIFVGAGVVLIVIGAACILKGGGNKVAANA